MNNTTIKVELVEAISEKCNCTQLEARDYLETVLGIMKSTFSEGSDLKVVGFGTFKVQLKNDRIGRNPQTGEAITILSRRILSFKPSVDLASNVAAFFYNLVENIHHLWYLQPSLQNDEGSRR